MCWPKMCVMSSIPEWENPGSVTSTRGRAAPALPGCGGKGTRGDAGTPGECEILWANHCRSPDQLRLLVKPVSMDREDAGIPSQKGEHWTFAQVSNYESRPFVCNSALTDVEEDLS